MIKGIALSVLLGASIAISIMTAPSNSTPESKPPCAFATEQKLPQCNKFPIQANYCRGDDVADAKGPLMVCTETCERRYMCHTASGSVYGVSVECAVADDT